ncbi:cupin domain-containing protein [Mucilaginibacter lappiensis]|uniref:Quercetin dioxygenase-like cupin family protein n=1 Tax=Mucilaginibacter lappiensis TaxID=354630 RepID=A0A841J5K2_9SPHI|nr:cupin domain-containing protein [Mucilaginibacter lappiensis]MBB6126074.1 quercetin dioxygenase-like cupin family protein [Mucilaginibacter lappiensis]
MTNHITTVNEDQGESLSVVGDAYRILISGKQTGGAYAVIDMLVPPGGGPGPHAHADMQELFYVVDGEIEFKTEKGKYTAKKGAFVNVPKGGDVHCFKNTSTETAHLLCTVIPAGLDAFFEEIGTPVAAGTFLPPPVLTDEDLHRLKQLAEKYGQKLYPPDYLD